MRARVERLKEHRCSIPLKPRSVQGERRVQLCVSVWSDSARKNFKLVEFLDRHLDRNKFALTLVGRLPDGVRLTHGEHIPPLSQRRLGSLLRRMDVLVAPSFNECYSNAETQALGCGLPVLALNDSSHREVVGPGGRFFGGADDIFQELEALIARYAEYERAATALDIDDVAVQYLIAAGLV